jgi:hypothetical protein
VATRTAKFRQVAWAYGLLSLVVVALNLFLGGTAERKGREVATLLPAIPVIALFAVLLWKAYPWVTWLARILALLAAARTLLFLLNFFGTQVRLSFRTGIILSPSAFAYHPAFLLSAILTGIICAMLVRAGWDL